MRNYKLSEVKEICKKYYPDCCTVNGDPNCPLYDGACFLDKDYPKDWVLDDEFVPMTCFYEPPIPDSVESIGPEIFDGDYLAPDGSIVLAKRMAAQVRCLYFSTLLIYISTQN